MALRCATWQAREQVALVDEAGMAAPHTAQTLDLQREQAVT